MSKSYWQPNIDNWILNENDAGSVPMSPNSKFGSNILGSKSGHPSAALPVKSEEEEVHDTLEQPYKGITTLKKLKQQIRKALEDVYGLSKFDDESENSGNPYDAIIELLNNPDLKTMLNVASEEIKKRNLSSF
jgi:hypothetical protein